MRRYCCILFFFACCKATIAQLSKTDSLQSALRTEQQDSNRVSLLWKLAEQYQFFKPDTSLQLSQQALLLARRIRYTEGESRSLAVMATAQYLLGNYSGALKNYLLKLQIEEKRNSTRNYVSALNNIGLMYILLADYSNALRYLHRADSTVQMAGGSVKSELGNRILINLGETFYRMKKADSANYYFSEVLKRGLSNHDGFYQGAALLGLGNVEFAGGNDSTAMANYRSAFDFLNDGTNNDMLCEATLGLAGVFQKSNQPDSALHFARLAFETARRDGFLSRELDAATFLSHLYKNKKMYDSAFVYMEQAAMLQDSLKGQSKTREAMIISSNEQLRQAELAEQKQRDNASRIQQLQILAICIFIPVFFMLTVAASKIRIHKNVVRFMGVVSLLLVFEFLVLLLHPPIGELTHHNKVLELLILVVMAAGLVPLHHKLEHLLIKKLTKPRTPAHEAAVAEELKQDITTTNAATIENKPWNETGSPVQKKTASAEETTEAGEK